MISRKLILFLGICLFSFHTSAQKVKYVFQAEAGLLFGEANLPGISARVLNGIRLDDLDAEVGFGTGVDSYTQMNFIPLTAGIKWYELSGKKWSPYVGLNAGYGIAWKDELEEFQTVQGGFLMNLMAGVYLKTSGKMNIIGTFGYRQQKGTEKWDDSSVNYDNPYLRRDKYTFRRVYAGFGVSF